MGKLDGTKTLENLKTAFSGESEARNKYTYYASKAKKEGYNQIAEFFEETANNEKEHAKLWFKLIHGIGTTEENLIDAAEGEKYEWTEMYATFAKEAREEGLDDIAEAFEGVAKIEKTHEERYVALCKNIKENKVFQKDEEVIWECGNCGHLVVSKEAPEICPVCKHPKAYFFIKKQNY